MYFELWSARCSKASEHSLLRLFNGVLSVLVIKGCTACSAESEHFELVVGPKETVFEEAFVAVVVSWEDVAAELTFCCLVSLLLVWSLVWDRSVDRREDNRAVGSKRSGGGWEHRATLAAAFSTGATDEVQVSEQSVENTPDVGLVDRPSASDTEIGSP